MDTVINQNLSYLQKNFPKILHKLQNHTYDQQHQRVDIGSKLNLKINIIRDKNDIESFSSPSYKIIEQQEIIKQKHINVSKVVIFSSFDINSLKHFLTNQHIHSVLIYETNLNYLLEVFHQIAFFQYSIEKKIFIATDYNELKELTFKFLLDKSYCNNDILLYSSNQKYTALLEKEYVGIFNDYFSLHFEAAASAVQNKSLNIKNKYQYLAVYNQFQNIELPILFLAPGPSLLKNIQWIEKHKNNFIIAAAGSALNILYENHIDVDIVFSVDMKIRIAEQFKNIDLKYLEKVLLIANESTDIGVLKLFKKVLISEYSNITVNHFALNILLGLGHKLILTLGNDAAYGSDGNEYSNGVIFDKYEDKSYINVAGNFQQNVLSSHEFFNHIKIYTEILSKHENLSIFNLSDGAYIEGMIPLAISEIQENTFPDIEDKKLEYQKTLHSFTYQLTYFEDIKVIISSLKKIKKRVHKNHSKNHIELIKDVSKATFELNNSHIQKILMNILFHVNNIIDEKDTTLLDIYTLYKNILDETLDTYIKAYSYQSSIHKPNIIIENYLPKNDQFSINKLVEINGVKTDSFLKTLLYKKKLKNKNSLAKEDGKFMVGLYLDTLDQDFKYALEIQLFNFTNHKSHLLKLNSLYQIMTKMRLEKLEDIAYDIIIDMYTILLNDQSFFNTNYSYLSEYIKYYYAFYLIKRDELFKKNLSELSSLFKNLLNTNISVFELISIYDHITFIYWGTMKQESDLKVCNNLVIESFSLYLNNYFKKTNIKKREHLVSNKKKRICFLLSKLVKSGSYSVGKIEYSLLRSLSLDSNEQYDFYCYEYWGIEEEYKQEIEKFSINLRSFSHINDIKTKLENMRNAFFEDNIDVVISDMPWGIPSYLFESRVANKQIYWSHGWHEYNMQEIDKRVTHGLAFETEFLNGYQYYKINIPHLHIKENEDNKEAKLIKKDYLNKFGSDTVILGTLSRLVKINNNEFIKTLSKIMSQNTNTIYLACGEGDQKDITKKLLTYNIDMKRFLFLGQVSSEIYFEVLDIWCDTFPIVQGESRVEAALRGLPLLLLMQESNEGFNLPKEQIKGYRPQQEIAKKYNYPFYPIITPEEYIIMAKALISNESFRKKIGQSFQNDYQRSYIKNKLDYSHIL